MKKILYTLIVLSIFFYSCKKDVFNDQPKASLNIANVIAGGTTARLGSIQLNINNNNINSFTLPAGENNLYVWPVGDSLHPYFTNSKFVMEDRASYSLWLGGTTSAVDGILVKDSYPAHVDSTCGVRFVNMSPNSSGFNIALASSPSVNEVSNLQYKQYTDFRIYPAKANPTSFQFLVKNTSDSVLMTYTFFPYRLANVTLVMRGMVGGSPALAITRVNNDR